MHGGAIEPVFLAYVTFYFSSAASHGEIERKRERFPRQSSANFDEARYSLTVDGG